MAILARSTIRHGDDDIFARIVKAIRQQGYAVVDNIFDLLSLHGILADIHRRENEFKQAGVGRQDDYQLNPFVRGDHICWLDLNTPLLEDYQQFIEGLRLAINRELFLGLFDYECHYAVYPDGAFYRRHLDAFKGESNRRLSTVLYLNPDWQNGDGGELQMYEPGEFTDFPLPFLSIEPLFGRMVFFLSEEFPHEVRPAKRKRYSLTGWYRINGA